MAGDPKTELKEMADQGTVGTPDYHTERHGGTEHQPGWTCTVRLPSGESAEGVGNSKVEAEKRAAAALLQKLKRGG